MINCSARGGETMLRNTEELTAVRMAEIERLVSEFREKLETGFACAQNTMKIDEIEDLWTRLRTGTDEVYGDMLSDYLASVDEREVIRQKKTNSAKKE
jgi:archaellum biogenesis protein FlaJ (TadC family)